jgi:hypothetical protein
MANTYLPTVNVSSDTFDSWIAATNSAIYALQSIVVTASPTGAGDYTYGNGYVQGILGANTLVATNIRSGNVQGANSTLYIQSNTAFSGNSVSVNGYVSVGQGLSVYQSANLVVNSSAGQVIDTFSNSSFRTVKYVISIKDNNANNYQATEIMLLQSGGNVYVTEYATLISNSSLAQFSANVASGNVNLLYTPGVSTNSTINIVKTMVSV